MDKHPLIEQYLSAVCRQVKAREIHKDIQQEMADHLEELVSLKKESGYGEEAAVQWAIEQMGDPEAAGAGLNRVHKPRIPWGLLGGLVIMLAISMIAMYVVELSYAAMQGNNSYMSHFLLNKVGFIAIGLVVIGVLFFMDYRRILSFSWAIYAGTIGVMILSIVMGAQMNGVRGYLVIGPFSIDWIGISPYLLIIAAAGIWIGMDSGKRPVWLQLFLLVALPALLFVRAHSFASLVMYAFSYVLLVISTRRNWREAVPTVVCFSLAAILYISGTNYALMRLAAFFQRYNDPQGAGYMYIQMDQAIRSAGWWGQGLSSVNPRLPYIYSDTLFTYLVYSLGWLAGGVVLLCAALFSIQIVSVALEVRDRYGKMLVSGLAALFTLQFVWSLGMSLGVLPIMGITIPLISYGGSHLLIQMGALGLVCSVYRRKDMIRIRKEA